MNSVRWRGTCFMSPFGVQDFEVALRFVGVFETLLVTMKILSPIPGWNCMRGLAHID